MHLDQAARANSSAKEFPAAVAVAFESRLSVAPVVAPVAQPPFAFAGVIAVVVVAAAAGEVVAVVEPEAFATAAARTGQVARRQELKRLLQ